MNLVPIIVSIMEQNDALSHLRVGFQEKTYTHTHTSLIIHTRLNICKLIHDDRYTQYHKVLCYMQFMREKTPWYSLHWSNEFLKRLKNFMHLYQKRLPYE